jgi:diacylglycerol kinase family enzyme
VDALLVAFANSPQYGNGAVIAPQARVDDGEVDVVVVEATRPFRDVLRARRLFDGTIARDRRAAILRAPRVVVEAEGPIRFHTDGEPCEAGDRLAVEVCPLALVVRVPAGSAP